MVEPLVSRRGRRLKQLDAERRHRSNHYRARYREKIAQLHAYLGNKCAECGIDDAASRLAYGSGLEIDHIDPSTKEYNPKAYWGRRIENLREELDKCQLLCFACHLDKTTALS